MKNLNILILCLALSLPVTSFAYGQLLPQPEEIQLPYSEIDTVPLVGVKDCPECAKSLKTGANKGDAKLIEWHKRKIFGDKGGDSESGSVDSK